MSNHSIVDRWFMRVKDIILIGASLIPCIILISKFYMLPSTVEAQAMTIKDHEVRIIALHEETAVLGQGIQDIKTDIKGLKP